jgi:hypothetical protein
VLCLDHELSQPVRHERLVFELLAFGCVFDEVHIIMKGELTMSGKPKASIFRIIQSDYLALIGSVVPLVGLALYAAVAYFGYLPGFRGRGPIQGTEDASLVLYFAVLGIVLGLPLVYWRVRTIQQRFVKSVEVIGQITGVYFHRDRGRVEYSYSYQGQDYSAGNAVMKNGRTRTLISGNPVVLLINPDNPKQPLIRDLYV